MKELGRVITAMVTPMDDRGEVDYAQAKRLARALAASGSDGLVVVGTTGESPTLRHDEEKKLFATVKEAVGDTASVIAGTGSNNTAEAVEYTRDAEEIGVDACLLVVPYYNKPSQEGLYQHFKTIADSTSLPCIPYNVPSRTVTNLAAETTVRLSHIKNIVGVKEASGNLEQISRIVREARPGFLVWSGNDSDTLPMLSVGAYGVISVASHLVGKQISEMVQAHVKGVVEKAAQIHRDLLPIFTTLFVISNPMPVKWAVNYVGLRVGKPRLPLMEPDEKSIAAIKEALAKTKIDLPV